MQAVKKEGNVFVVDFRELCKNWLPAEKIKEQESETFENPVIKGFYEKKRKFFEELGLEEPFKAVLEFLDQHRDSVFNRRDREISLVDHSLRTAEFAFALSGSLMPEERAVVVLSALAHDLGKAVVEKSRMREHPEHSFEILNRIGLYNGEWDRVLKEADPLEVSRVRNLNAVCYLARYHHSADVPAVDAYTADSLPLLKKLFPYLKRADSAAAVFELGEARSEAEALQRVLSETRQFARKLEKKADEIEAERQAENSAEEKLSLFLQQVARGINQPADGRTASKVYGYTMREVPLVALVRRKAEELAKGILGIVPEDLEKVLSPFSLEDGKVLRPCIVRSYPSAPGKREMFYVLNWDKVSSFLREKGEKPVPFSQLNKRRKTTVVVLAQE